MQRYAADLTARKSGSIGLGARVRVTFDAHQGDDLTARALEAAQEQGLEYMPGPLTVRPLGSIQ